MYDLSASLTDRQKGELLRIADVRETTPGALVAEALETWASACADAADLAGSSLEAFAKRAREALAWWLRNPSVRSKN